MCVCVPIITHQYLYNGSRILILVSWDTFVSSLIPGAAAPVWCSYHAVVRMVDKQMG